MNHLYQEPGNIFKVPGSPEAYVNEYRENEASGRCVPSMAWCRRTPVEGAGSANESGRRKALE